MRTLFLLKKIIFILFLISIRVIGYCSEISDSLEIDINIAVGIGINNNFDLKKLRAQGLVNELSIYEKYRNFFPTLSVSYITMEESKIRDEDSRQHKINLESEITVYDGGKTRLDYEITSLQADLGKNDYKIAFWQYIGRVRLQYLQVLQLRKVIYINEKTLEQGRLQYDFIQREKTLGDATELDVMEIGAQVREIEYNLKKAIDDYNNAEYALKTLLRIHWHKSVRLAGDIEDSFIFKSLSDNFDSSELVKIALKNRKELLSSEIEKKINERKYKMSKYYYIPNFGIGLNYNLTGEETMPREKGWGVTFKVSTALFGNTSNASMGYSESGNGNTRAINNNATVNVLDNMSYKRNIYESKMNLNASKDKRLTVEQQIGIEVVQSVESLKNAWEMINLSRDRMDLYDKSLVIERMKADMGEIRRYDLMKKEIERGQSAISFNDSLYKYLVSATELENSLGVELGFLQLSNVK